MRSERSPLPIRLLRVAGDLLPAARAPGVVDARRQHRHGLRLVAVLRAVVLAFDDDAGGQVGDAHRRIGLVDVLAAGARGAEGVDAQVGGLMSCRRAHRLRASPPRCRPRCGCGPGFRSPARAARGGRRIRT
jgi:hypothetical protein